MRGKVQIIQRGNVGFGITPAYAGKSAISLRCSCPWWDHPRLCGEKLSAEPDKRLRQGSPPPMRGKAKCGSDNVSVQGITPAYAGKSMSSP